MSPLLIGCLAAVAMILAKALFLRWLMRKADSAPRAAPGPAEPPEPG